MNPRAKLASGEVERRTLLLMLARRDGDGERSRELTGSGSTGGTGFDIVGIDHTETTKKKSLDHTGERPRSTNRSRS